MIDDLKIIDDETAAAFGQKFDVRKVLDAGIDFIEAFAAEVVPAMPEIRPTARFKGDRDAIQPLDGDAFARLRREILSVAKRWDVASECLSAGVGPFRLRFYPLGKDDLQRHGDADPRLVTEGSWRDLDPTPIIDFLPIVGLPIFGPAGIAALKHLVPRHAPNGTREEFDLIPSLRFPHHSFGAGYGVIRISLLTVPVDS